MAIETTVVDLETVDNRSPRGTKDVTLNLPDGRVLALHQRRVSGMRKFIPTAAKTGTVQVDSHGTVVDWYYVAEPTPPVNGSSDYINQKPVVAVDYQGEAYHAEASKFRYRQFGVTDEIMGRTWLIIRPPVYSDKRPTEWGVLTQASRNMLIAKGGGELPWEEWGDAFYQRFPRELAEARDRAREQVTRPTDPTMAKHLSRILDRLNPRFKASRLVSSAMGKILAHPAAAKTGSPGMRAATPAKSSSTGTGGGGTGGEGTTLTEGPDGPISAAERVVRGGYPTYRWKKFDLEDAKYLADFNPKDTHVEDGTTYVGVIYLNSSHPVFVQEFNHWSSSVWPKADPAKVTELLHRVYGEEAVAHVVHAQRLNGTVVARQEEGGVVQIGREDVDELLRKTALSAALLGLVNVEQRILTQGGGLFGSRSNS